MVDVDENYARVTTPRVSRIVLLGNIKDFLNEEDGILIDELKAKAEAEAKRRAEEAEANKPVKEKKHRKMTPAEMLAKKKAEIMELEDALRKMESGDLPIDYLDKKKKKTKIEAIEDLDTTENIVPEVTEAMMNELI